MTAIYATPEIIKNSVLNTGLCYITTGAILLYIAFIKLIISLYLEKGVVPMRHYELICFVDLRRLHKKDESFG